MSDSANNKLIGFIGQGWIGKNYADDFEQRGYKIVRYSKEEPYTENKNRIKDCDIVFIAVPAPTTPRGFNDSILREPVKLVGKGKTAVIKSTLLPGITESIQADNPDIFVLHSPEFLSRKTAAYEAAHPERNIVGVPAKNELYYQKAREVIAVLPKAPYNLICAAKNAELIKYGGNCFLYFKNIYFNLLYDLSEKLGNNWELVRSSVVADPRIGGAYSKALDRGGRGAGGDCLLKDFQSFLDLYNQLVNDATGKKILESIRDKNLQLLIESKKDFDFIKTVYGDSVLAERVAAPTGKSYKILVTGGAGFIGSNLVDELVRLGHEVVVIDDLSTGKIEYLNPAARFYQADIRDNAIIEEIFSFESTHAPIDYVYHLAAQIDVRKSVADPIFDNQVNTMGSINIFLNSAKQQIKKLIFISTGGAMYGDVDYPATEDRLPTPDSPYAIHKLAAEHNLAVIAKTHKMPYTILRLANVYGPRQFKGGEGAAIAVFTHNAISRQPSIIYGDGRQSRDFICVDDVVSICLSSAFGDASGVFNVGSGRETEILALAEIIGKITGGNFNYSHQPARAGEVYRSVLSSEKAKKDFGWEPKISLEEGLKKTIDWSKKQLGL